MTPKALKESVPRPYLLACGLLQSKGTEMATATHSSFRTYGNPWRYLAHAARGGTRFLR